MQLHPIVTPSLNSMEEHRSSRYPHTPRYIPSFVDNCKIPSQKLDQFAANNDQDTIEFRATTTPIFVQRFFAVCSRKRRGSCDDFADTRPVIWRGDMVSPNTFPPCSCIRNRQMSQSFRAEHFLWKSFYRCPLCGLQGVGARARSCVLLYSEGLVPLPEHSIACRLHLSCQRTQI